jgi:hypothetical protein
MDPMNSIKIIKEEILRFNKYLKNFKFHFSLSSSNLRIYMLARIKENRPSYTLIWGHKISTNHLEKILEIFSRALKVLYQ